MSAVLVRDQNLLADAVKRYSEAIASTGPAAIAAQALRAEYSDDVEFCAFADALDQLHANLLQSAKDAGSQDTSATGQTTAEACAAHSVPAGKLSTC